MPIGIENASDPTGRMGAIPAEQDMKKEMKEKLLSNFDLLDEQKKNQVIAFIKQLVDHSQHKGSRETREFNGSPWKDIIPLRLDDGASLSEIIVADRAETDE